MKKLYALLLFVFSVTFSFAQISVLSTGSALTENFNTLVNSGTGTSANVPAGWAFLETGSGANTTYTASPGSATADTYSFGTGTSTDRAFGGLQSNNLNPTIGVSYTNNTGAAITSVTVTYTGEEWRLGVAGRTDRLAFQYSLNATSLSTGTWTNETTLDFITPFTTTAGNTDGNNSANRTLITSTITGLNIPNGATFWFRWSDINISGNDDGLGIDDYSATFFGAGSVVCTAPASQPTALTFPTVTSNSITGSFTATTADGYLVIRSATAPSAPTNGVTYTPGAAYGSGVVVSTGATTGFTDNGLTPSTTYSYYVFAYNNVGCTGGPAYNTVNPLQNSSTTAALPGCTAPATPTALSLNPSNNAVSGSFTGSGAGKYLVIMSTSSSLSSAPVNGTNYANGASVGGGTVVSNSTNTFFTAGGLTVSTTYYFFVYAMNTGCTGEPFYSTTSLDGNTTTTNVATGIPPGYYNAAAGLTCSNLKDALSSIITTGQVTLSYSTIDDNEIPVADTIRSDDGLRSIIWDIYSNNTTGPEPFEYNSSQNPVGGFCGGSGTSNCWNKEHTFPQSWFGSQSPTVADLFVVRPTDIKINGQRGNMPYSIVGGSTTYTFPATTSTYPGVPILDKIGASTAPGVSVSPAFEPSDGVKGDIARAYFYILTRYQNNLASWVSANSGSGIATVVDGTTGGGLYPSFQLPYLTMMYNWHVADPVDTREINYNNNVYSQQNNRNPYIDHPEYVAKVFQCTGVIPVTLIDFTAQKIKSSVLLQWYATQETSFKRFEIERSADGIHFNKIGEVEGQNLANYSFTDNDLPNVTVVYYRLRMVDADGKSRLGKIAVVKIDNSISGATVYPNPATGILHIRLNAALQAASQLLITDMAGRAVQQQSANSGESDLTLDVSHFPAGRYFIRIINSRQVINQSFTVAR